MVGEDEAERFRQMQLDMLRSENKHLDARLDELTVALHSKLPPMEPALGPLAHDTPFGSPGKPQLQQVLTESIHKHTQSQAFAAIAASPCFLPEKMGKCPKMTEFRLTFEGNLASCDRGVVSCKLLHLKRLLHRRVQAAMGAAEQARAPGDMTLGFKTMGYVFDALDRLHDATESVVGGGGRRICVVCSQPVSVEVQSALRRDICAIANFTQGLNLAEDAIAFEVLPARRSAACSHQADAHAQAPADQARAVASNGAPVHSTQFAHTNTQDAAAQRSPKLNRILAPEAPPARSVAQASPAAPPDPAAGGAVEAMAPLFLAPQGAGGASVRTHAGAHVHRAEHGSQDGEDVKMVYIVVVGLNKGAASGDAWEMSTLNEMCELDSVCWDHLLPARTAAPAASRGPAAARGGLSLRMSMSWANFDLPSADAGEETVVCCGREGGRAGAGAGAGAWGGISLYYPKHLQELHRLRSGVLAGGRRELVQRMLEDHIDAIRFHEVADPSLLPSAPAPLGSGAEPAEATAAADSAGAQTFMVPVTMPEWTGAMLWQLASRHDTANDLWLSFLTSSQHRLLQVAQVAAQGSLPPVPPVSVGSWQGRGEATQASISLFFELERQQELVRRKIASLERLMHCKLFVGQVDSFTARLQKHAEQLFSGIRIKQETPNTLDTLCSQLSSLSMQCEESIMLAMEAVKRAGEAAQDSSSHETSALVQQQLSRIRQANSAKEHVDRIKSEVEDALASKRAAVLPDQQHQQDHAAGSRAAGAAAARRPPLASSPPAAAGRSGGSAIHAGSRVSGGGGGGVSVGGGVGGLGGAAGGGGGIDSGGGIDIAIDDAGAAGAGSAAGRQQGQAADAVAVGAGASMCDSMQLADPSRAHSFSSSLDSSCSSRLAERFWLVGCCVWRVACCVLSVACCDIGCMMM